MFSRSRIPVLNNSLKQIKLRGYEDSATRLEIISFKNIILTRIRKRLPGCTKKIKIRKSSKINYQRRYRKINARLLL
jgi:hypothetical protein